MTDYSTWTATELAEEWHRQNRIKEEARDILSEIDEELSHRESMRDEPQECYTCRGSGEGQYDGSRCYSCKGSGVERREED